MKIFIQEFETLMYIFLKLQEKESNVKDEPFAPKTSGWHRAK